MLLDSWLQIDEQRVSRKYIVPYRVRFELNRLYLAELQQLKTNNFSVTISANKLINLRYYVWLAHQNLEELPLIFLTNYVQNEQNISMVKSIISFEGKISQQIPQSVCYNSLLIDQILPIHQWLIEQIIKQLTWKTQNYSLLIAVILSLIITAGLIFIVEIILFLPILIKLLTAVGLEIGLTYFIHYLLSHQVKAWIEQQLRFGLLSSQIRRRKIGLKLLSILG